MSKNPKRSSGKAPPKRSSGKPTPKRSPEEAPPVPAVSAPRHPSRTPEGVENITDEMGLFEAIKSDAFLSGLLGLIDVNPSNNQADRDLRKDFGNRLTNSAKTTAVLTKELQRRVMSRMNVDVVETEYASSASSIPSSSSQPSKVNRNQKRSTVCSTSSDTSDDEGPPSRGLPRQVMSGTSDDEDDKVMSKDKKPQEKNKRREYSGDSSDCSDGNLTRQERRRLVMAKTDDEEEEVFRPKSSSSSQIVLSSKANHSRKRARNVSTCSESSITQEPRRKRPNNPRKM